jgi:hypothetical protein
MGLAARQIRNPKSEIRNFAWVAVRHSEFRIPNSVRVLYRQLLVVASSAAL